MGCDSGTVPRGQFCTTVPATTPHRILREEAFTVHVTLEVPLWPRLAENTGVHLPLASHFQERAPGVPPSCELPVLLPVVGQVGRAQKEPVT